MSFKAFKEILFQPTLAGSLPNVSHPPFGPLAHISSAGPADGPRAGQRPGAACGSRFAVKPKRGGWMDWLECKLDRTKSLEAPLQRNQNDASFQFAAACFACKLLWVKQVTFGAFELTDMLVGQGCLQKAKPQTRYVPCLLGWQAERCSPKTSTTHRSQLGRVFTCSFCSCSKGTRKCPFERASVWRRPPVSRIFHKMVSASYCIFLTTGGGGLSPWSDTLTARVISSSPKLVTGNGTQSSFEFQ